MSKRAKTMTLEQANEIAQRRIAELEAELAEVKAENERLRQRLHMAEQQIRECRQYLRLDDRDLVVGHIDAYFALPALNSGEGMR